MLRLGLVSILIAVLAVIAVIVVNAVNGEHALTQERSPVADSAARIGHVPPVVGGLLREGLPARVRGLVLMGELGCAACHDSAGMGTQIDSKPPLQLQAIGARVDPHYLRRFLSDPLGVKAGTTMPDVMASLSLADREDAADALTHYLVSRSETGFVPSPPDRVAVTRGMELFHSVGCVACHAPRDDAGVEQVVGESVPLGALHRKYSVAGLSEFLRAPHRIRPGARMPDFALKPQEIYDLSHYLLASVKIDGRLGYTAYLEPKMDGAGVLGGRPLRSGLSRDFSLAPWRDLREDFAVEFTGFLTVEKSGTYSFEVDSDSAARLRVGSDQLLLPESKDRRSGRDRLRVDLAAGVHRISLAYLYRAGGAAPIRATDKRRLQLHWSSPGSQRSDVASAVLHAERVPPAPFVPFVSDAGKVVKGRRFFTSLGCVRCHEMNDAELPAVSRAAPLAVLDTTKGCLSTVKGQWPDFALSDAQRREIVTAMAASEQPLTRAQRIDKILVSLNCIACHKRDSLGGPLESRLEFFGTDAAHLGDAGRIPPPLSGVGAKLQKGWLTDAIAEGQSERPYLGTQMPGFGRVYGERLAELLGAEDLLPAVAFDPMPEDNKKRRVITDAGQKLAGFQGMNCIACHTFAGRRASEMAAIDLVETTTQRLRKEWFYHYMLEPARFKPGTLMPQFFPNGVSARGDVLGGDAKAQVHAIWEYLALGRNTRAPRGLTRPSMEVVVGDEAVILRRSAQNTGKRGISVGLPSQLSFTFDAETIALNQIWWGKFIDTSPVFTGQGSGQVRMMGRERVTLPKGPAFATLATDDAEWPVATRRELGHRFRGYDLDARQRPIFRYECEGVAITDTPVEVAVGGTAKPTLRRTFTLRSAMDRVLFFRAALDARIEKLSGGEGSAVQVGGRPWKAERFQVGESLVLWVPAGAHLLRTVGDQRELLVRASVVGGEASFVLDYRWKERVK